MVTEQQTANDTTTTITAAATSTASTTHPWAVLAARLDQVCYDSGVDLSGHTEFTCQCISWCGREAWVIRGGPHLEQIVTGHAWLAGDAGRDDDHVTAPQGIGQRRLTFIALCQPTSQLSTHEQLEVA